MEGVEPFVDAARDALREHLSDAIAAINAAVGEAAGSFDIRPLEDDADYYVGGADVPPARYPYLEVAVPDAILFGFSLGNVVMDLAPVLVVKVVTLEPALAGARERLYRALTRYIRAIQQVLIVPGALGTAHIDEERGMRAAYRFNPDTAEAQELVGAAVLVINLSGVELQ